MRVLLIRPPARHTVESEVPEAVEAENLSYPPLALLAIASFLRDHSTHPCEILDAQLEDLEYDVVEQRIRDYAPDVVGIIISTSLGSTAYSSSAGGSPSHPLLNAFHITPICPHSPRLRSFLVPLDSSIDITALHPQRRPTQAVSDGISHGEAKQLHISCSAKKAQLIFLDSHNFTETMVRKVLHT